MTPTVLCVTFDLSPPVTEICAELRQKEGGECNVEVTVCTSCQLVFAAEL